LGKTITATGRITAIICACLATILIVATPVSAQVVPDTFEITTSVVSTGLHEPGDYLFFCQYEVAWALPANYPDDPISETVVVQLIDPLTDDAIASTSPYPYYNNGYDKGLVAIYMSQLDAVAANITWQTGYKFQIVSTPGAFATPQSYEYIIPTNEYCQSGTTSQAANRDWIREYCLNTGYVLTINWVGAGDLTLQSIDMVLSPLGEAYLLRVMPGLRDLVPLLFLATVVTPEFEETVWSGTHSDAMENIWSGTDVVSTGIDGLDGLTEGRGVFATNFLVLGLMLAVILVAGATLKAIAPGLLAGSIVVIVGADLGFLEVALLSIFELLILLYAINKTVGLNRT